MAIQILDPLVSERIAAGEVIERPASAVKELVENAIDAGATEILVRIEEGGKRLIEILDNGSGMDPRDLQICALRHATSKIKTADDLESLVSLGFRGEALPSIAACSQLEILSKTPASASAFQVKWNFATSLEAELAQAVTFGHFLNSDHGTRVQVRNLFSQVPARLKFMKSDRAETSAIREWLEKLSLAHPSVGFELWSGVEGQSQVLWSVQPQSETQRAFEFLSDGQTTSPIVTETFESLELGAKLRLHWLQGLSLSHTRKLVQCLNGRVLRDRLLQSALLSPFRQHLLPGQFPALALYMELSPKFFDVNVHPTKTEVRFLESSKIFRIVETLAENLLGRAGAPVHVPSFAPRAPWVAGQTSWNARDSGQDTFQYIPLNSDSPPHFGAEVQSTSAGGSEIAPSSNEGRTAAPNSQTSPSSPTSRDALFQRLQNARWAGQLFKTYLLFETQEDEVFLVDQHAAHERIRYEQLRKRFFSKRLADSQSLLMPETIRFPAETLPDVQERLPKLAEMGFECEIFGADRLLVRSIPAFWGNQDLEIRLRTLLDKLLSAPLTSDAPSALATQDTYETRMDEALFEALASQACHSAVRAGDLLIAEEVHAIIQGLGRSENPWNCPHGRPTVAIASRIRFEEWFQRKL